MGHRDIAFISPPLTYASRPPSGWTAFSRASRRAASSWTPIICGFDYERDDENVYEFNIGSRLAEKLMQLDTPPQRYSASMT